jgi:hypothetical protein
MPRVHQPSPSAPQPSSRADGAPGVGRKRPVLLAFVAVTLVLWLGFLAYLAFRG